MIQKLRRCILSFALLESTCALSLSIIEGFTNIYLDKLTDLSFYLINQQLTYSKIKIFAPNQKKPIKNIVNDKLSPWFQSGRLDGTSFPFSDNLEPVYSHCISLCPAAIFFSWFCFSNNSNTYLNATKTKLDFSMCLPALCFSHDPVNHIII